MDIWTEWNDGTTWTVCPSNMYLDSRNQWQLWTNGEYFDSTSQVWRSWNGSWQNLWAYQSFWFDWPTDLYFDLNKMKWVTSCDSSSIQIIDDQLWNKPVCRDLNYYINPSSQQIIELGTKTYPYKNIGLPFVEILNYHSHSNRTITVNIL